MKKLLIWVPSYAWNLNIELVKFLDNVQLPEWRVCGKCYTLRTPVHMARNMILEKTIEWEYDGVIMIDDDQYPEKPDCFKKLIEAWQDMVSGVVRLRVNKENLNILYKEDYKEPWKEGMKRYINHKECQNWWLFEIDNAWSGLIYLSKEVCKKMYDRYWKEPFESKATVYVKLTDWSWEELGYNRPDLDQSEWKPKMCRRVLSEDYLFFERAISQGYKLYCYWDCKCVHLWEPEKIKV